MQTADNKTLRSFALTFGIMMALIFGLLVPWIWGYGFPRWPWIVLGVAAVWGLAAPGTLAPVYRVWMWLAEKLGWINNRIILGLIFFVVMFPIGVLRRLFGWDPMNRRYDPNASTYRTPKSLTPKEHFERLF